MAVLECNTVGAAAAAGFPRMKVLVVSQAFPPFNASGCVRVGKLARFLHESGHEVRVLTAAPLPYPRTLPAELPDSHVIVTTSLDPFAWLAWRRERQQRRLPRQNDGRAAASTRSLVGNGWSGRALRSAGALFAIPDPQIGWFAPAVRAGQRLFRTWQPELIYASALPFTAHLVAARLATIVGAPWIAEFRDQFADNPYSTLPSWRAPIDRWVERRVLSGASACVTVSEPIAETLRHRHGKPTAVVLNGFDSRVPAAAATTGDSDRLSILYTGLIYPGRRDPSALFAAMRSLGPLAGRIDVHFYGQDLRDVAVMAERHGVSASVHVHGTIPYADSLDAQRRADVLLLLLCNDVREAGVFTGKLFEYVGAGRPILAVGAERGVAVELIRSRGLGVVAMDADRIAAVLREWLAEKEATSRVAAPDADAKAGLSRDEQFAIVDRLMRAAVGRETFAFLPADLSTPTGPISSPLR